jgi:hypothetical protein
MRLSPTDAEKLLAKYWTSLRYVSNFVQVALYVATPALLERVRQALADCTEPQVLLKHLGQHIGLKTEGHPGITRSAQIESLAPYLRYLGKHTIMGLWDICNEHGWFDLRRSVLDPHLRQSGGILYEDEAPTFAALDDMVTRNQMHWLDHWLEQYAMTGASSEDRLARIAAWLGARKTMDALQLVSEAVAQIGRRADLSLLDIPLADADARLEAIKANVVFAVQRRTLT